MVVAEIRARRCRAGTTDGPGLRGPVRRRPAGYRSAVAPRLAQPAFNDGATIFRRGYSYHDGIVPETGDLDAGLFFLAFVSDVSAEFVPVQRRLAEQGFTSVSEL